MSEYGVYPNSTPEFRMLQKEGGTMVMQVRYVCASQGYTGKWLDVKIEKENGTQHKSSPSSNV